MSNVLADLIQLTIAWVVLEHSTFKTFISLKWFVQDIFIIGCLWWLEACFNLSVQRSWGCNHDLFTWNFLHIQHPSHFKFLCNLITLWPNVWLLHNVIITKCIFICWHWSLVLYYVLKSLSFTQAWTCLFVVSRQGFYIVIHFFRLCENIWWMIHHHWYWYIQCFQAISIQKPILLLGMHHAGCACVFLNTCWTQISLFEVKWYLIIASERRFKCLSIFSTFNARVYQSSICCFDIGISSGAILWILDWLWMNKWMFITWEILFMIKSW